MSRVKLVAGFFKWDKIAIYTRPMSVITLTFSLQAMYNLVFSST